jgi:dolichol kinase
VRSGIVLLVPLPRILVIDALHELVDGSEMLCVHGPRAADAERLRALAARVYAAVATAEPEALGLDPAVLSAQVDALVVLLDHDHEPTRWRSARAPLVAAYEAVCRRADAPPPAARPRSKPHNLARTLFHVLSGVMWALLYEHVLDRGPLLCVIAGCLVFFVTDDVMRRWFPERRSGFAVAVFRMLSRSSEASRMASSTWYALGLLVCVGLLPKPACLTGILVLAFADPAAGLVGRRWGGPKLYRDKSLGGTTAFFVVALAVMAVGLALEQPMLALAPRLLLAAAIAFAGTIAELLGDHVQDNFSIPVVTGILAALVL